MSFVLVTMIVIVATRIMSLVTVIMTSVTG